MVNFNTTIHDNGKSRLFGPCSRLMINYPQLHPYHLRADCNCLFDYRQYIFRFSKYIYNIDMFRYCGKIRIAFSAQEFPYAPDSQE